MVLHSSPTRLSPLKSLFGNEVCGSRFAGAVAVLPVLFISVWWEGKRDSLPLEPVKLQPHSWAGQRWPCVSGSFLSGGCGVALASECCWGLVASL